MHDDSFHCMQCMMKASNPSIVLRNHTTPALHINTYSSWWYLSTHALHDDTWSAHTLYDDTNQHKQCTSLTWWYISSDAVHNGTRYNLLLNFTFIAWWHMSSLHDDTCHPSQWMMISFITHSAWRYNSSLALHDDITQHKQCMMITTISRDVWLNHSSQAL